MAKCKHQPGAYHTSACVCVCARPHLLYPALPLTGPADKRTELLGELLSTWRELTACSAELVHKILLQVMLLCEWAEVQ